MVGRAQRAWAVLVSLVAFVVATSCQWRSPVLPDTDAPVAGVTIGKLEVGSRLRTYRTYVPPSLPAGERVPLLVALHGGLGSGEQFEAQSEFDALADADGFIVVYPNGVDLGTLPGGVWNGGVCCGRAQADRQNVDDVEFVRDLVSTLTGGLPVDESRVYATGHSNGAILAYRLACELSDRIAAIALQAGTLGVAECAPQRAVPLMHIHGADDASVPIDGGRGSGLSNTDFPSPRAGIERYATVNGCTDESTVTDAANPDVTRRQWTVCRDGAAVELVVVAGANHAWMGHESTNASRIVVGAPYVRFDSSAAVWDFVSRWRR